MRWDSVVYLLDDEDGKSYRMMADSMDAVSMMADSMDAVSMMAGSMDAVGMMAGNMDAVRLCMAVARRWMNRRQEDVF